MTSKLLGQQNLISVFATQPIRTVDEDSLNLAFRGEVAHPLQARSFERGSTIAVVFEDPGLRHLEVEGLANSINAAVWLAIVCASRCCSEETRA